MNYEIVGIERKQGDYQGAPYDNTLLHTLSLNVNVAGRKTDIIKVKTPVFQTVLKNCGCGSNDLLGKTADITFDKYSNLEYFELLPPNGK